MPMRVWPAPRRSAHLALAAGLMWAGCQPAGRAPGNKRPAPDGNPATPLTVYGPRTPDPTGDSGTPTGEPDPHLAPLPAPAAPACPGTGTARFENVAACAGLQSALHVQVATNATAPNRYGTAHGIADLDNDGWLDIVIAGPAAWNKVYLGSSDGSFTERAEPALEGLPADTLLLVDFDNDGFKDAFFGSTPDATLMGSATGFTLVPGPDEQGNTMGASAADVDGDGVLELYVADYDCTNCGFQYRCEGPTDHLWLQGPTGWEDVSTQVFPDYPLFNCGLGFIGQWADWDSDGDLDLFVANDRGQVGPVPGINQPTPRNASWRNLGPGCGSACFEEVGGTDGTAGYMNAMGTAAGDYDNDGDLDLAVSDSGPTRLFRNDGTGQFEDVTDAAGLGVMPFMDGWHVAWLDHDNDGDLDLFTARSGQNLLYDNDGGVFTDISDQILDVNGPHRGAVAVDYDRDGRVDLFVGQTGGAWKLLRNTTETTNHWVGLRLVGNGAGGRDAIGARVHVTDSTGAVQLREVALGSGGASGPDVGVHFGLGTATLDTVVVTWPDQTTQVVEVYDDAWTVVTKP